MHRRCVCAWRTGSVCLANGVYVPSRRRPPGNCTACVCPADNVRQVYGRRAPATQTGSLSIRWLACAAGALRACDRHQPRARHTAPSQTRVCADRGALCSQLCGVKRASAAARRPRGGRELHPGGIIWQMLHRYAVTIETPADYADTSHEGPAVKLLHALIRSIDESRLMPDVSNTWVDLVAVHELAPIAVAAPERVPDATRLRRRRLPLPPPRRSYSAAGIRASRGPRRRNRG